jgi:hypothetical protein
MKTGCMVLSFALLAAGCGGRSADAPPRSPGLDYPPPPVETSDGQVVGADRMAPGDKLASGARVGVGGVVPADSHKSEPKTTPPKPRPCDEIGLQDPAGRSGCTPGAPSPGAGK